MDREKLDRWCEKGILGLVLTILVFGTLATGAVRTLEFLIIQGLTLGVIFLWAARFWLTRSHRLLFPPICWAVVLFVAYAIFRYLKADVEYVARLELIRVLIYAFLFFAILNNLYRQETAQLVVYVLVFLAMVVSVYAIYQFITMSGYVWTFKRPPQYLRRGSGTFICPNHFAGFAEMILPLGIAFTLSGRLNSILKVFLGYASLVILAGIGASVSRGGWICTALATGLLLFLLVKRHHRYRIPAIVAMVVLVVGAGMFYTKSSSAQQRVADLSSGMGVALSGSDIRVTLWKAAGNIWLEHPWIGGGPAHYDLLFPKYRSRYFQARPDRTHNDYLNTLADWGVIGLGLVLLILGLFYRGVFRSWKFVQHSSNDLSSKPSNRSAVVLGGAIGITTLALHSFVDFNMHIPANAILAVTLVALVSTHLRFASERYWVSSRPPLRVLISLVALAGICYLGATEVRRFREYLHLHRYETGTTDEARIAELEKAFAIEPRNPETAYLVAEIKRLKSWRLDAGWEELAASAAEWFKRAIALNRYDARSYSRLGMCLHWLNRPQEAGPYFDIAVKLDPNGYYTLANLGWHYVQLEQWAKAKEAFERSLWAKPNDNKIATSYLKIVTNRLEEEQRK
jgi:O-antigen ligase